MTNDECVKLLRAIAALAIVPYPFCEGAKIDPNLALAFGEIRGTAERVLRLYRQPEAPPAFKLSEVERTLIQHARSRRWNVEKLIQQFEPVPVRPGNDSPSGSRG